MGDFSPRHHPLGALLSEACKCQPLAGAAAAGFVGAAARARWCSQHVAVMGLRLRFSLSGRSVSKRKSLLPYGSCKVQVVAWALGDGSPAEAVLL